MKEFKLTTMALLIGSLLMTNNAYAKIYNEDEGIITGSGVLTEGGSYKIVSTSGENNTISVANNGGLRLPTLAERQSLTPGASLKMAIFHSRLALFLLPIAGQSI